MFRSMIDLNFRGDILINIMPNRSGLYLFSIDLFIQYRAEATQFLQEIAENEWL